MKVNNQVENDLIFQSNLNEQKENFHEQIEKLEKNKEEEPKQGNNGQNTRQLKEEREQKKNRYQTLVKTIETQKQNPKVIETKRSFLPVISKFIKNDNQLFLKKLDYIKKRNYQQTLIIQKTPTIHFNNKKIFSEFNHKKHSKSLKPSTSLQAQKKSNLQFKDQFYLPSFIKNFKLPPKKQFHVIQTMETFKKRQTHIHLFLDSVSQLKQYKILSNIGKGAFSLVSLALNLQNNKKYAIKTYTKFDQIQQYKFICIQKEIEVMKKLKNHYNVVAFQKAFLQQRKIHIIMENCGQQSLAGMLRKKKMLAQKEAKIYFKQIINGILYCHQQDICHRDLKLENILINQIDCIKIIDFGFSSFTHKPLNNFCGTPPYMSPEIVQKQTYNGKCADIWAIGIILYIMLYGDFPFKSVNQKQLYRLIKYGKFQHNQSVSVEAREVVDSMLRIDTKQRATAQQILNLKWVKN